MSDELDWNFSNDDEAKAEIRAAVEYLLRGATGGARGDIVQEIIAIVRQIASVPAWSCPAALGESRRWERISDGSRADTVTTRRS